MANVMLGRTFGSVTMVAPLDITDYVYLVSDPGTAARMMHYMRGGERSAWIKIGMLKHHVTIARALEDALLIGPKSADVEFMRGGGEGGRRGSRGSLHRRKGEHSLQG